MFAPPAAMTGQLLYNFMVAPEGLLAGQQPDPATMITIFNIVQSIIEDERDWMVMRKQDASQTVLASGNFKTAYNLNPNGDFLRLRSERPVVLYAVGNTDDYLDDLVEVPLEYAISSQDDSNKFYCDYANGNIYFCGKQDKNRLLQINYIAQPSVITLAGAWSFPARFHPIIAFAAAVLYKAGIDYDETNARQAVNNDSIYQKMLGNMRMWDANLQLSSLKGVPRGGGGMPEYGGRVNGFPS